VLKSRLISFPLLLGLVATVFFCRCGQQVFFALVTLIGALAAYELSCLARKLVFPVYPKVTAAAALLLTGMFTTVLLRGAHLALAAGIGYFVLLALIFAPWIAVLCRKTEVFKGLLGSFAMAFWVLIPLLFCEVFYTEHFPKAGVNPLLFLILVTKSMDTGGYIAGMLTAKYLPGGNHKIAPGISPKKSWEGFAGGMALSTGVAFALMPASGISWYFALISGIVLAVGSFFGDLTESALKRAAEVKDSGSWIPGMGGICDVLDSFIYNGALFALLFFTMGK